jgi:hypothetical protein
VEENKDMTDSERLIQALKAYHVSMFMIISVVVDYMTESEIASLKSISMKMMEETLRSIHRTEEKEEFIRLNKDFLDFLEEIFQETVGISADEYLSTKKKFDAGDFN